MHVAIIIHFTDTHDIAGLYRKHEASANVTPGGLMVSCRRPREGHFRATYLEASIEHDSNKATSRSQSQQPYSVLPAYMPATVALLIILTEGECSILRCKRPVDDISIFLRFRHHIPERRGVT